jgi:hypothetical protein
MKDTKWFARFFSEIDAADAYLVKELAKELAVYADGLGGNVPSLAEFREILELEERLAGEEEMP